ncbi:AAA family ATPase [Nonomuraea insulae]|uniref:AAA family ATPase n=1 Tax=Nonomuraea insulae TaxID=1616787 RepID=A0ABW1CK27_9ACTN
MSDVVLEALSIAVSAGVPALLWGSPGTGKTSAVVALAESLNWPIEVVIGSIREPSDFAGLPVITSEGTVRLAPPAWAERLATAGHGLLFLDELTTAPPAVQAAMLRVVLERAVGDVRLPDKVQVVAAANPPEEAADGWELAAPLANRLVHLNWPVDGRQIAQGLALGFPPPPLTAFTQPPSHAQATEARATVAAFLQVRPALALQVPSSGGISGGGTWGSGPGGGMPGSGTSGGGTWGSAPGGGISGSGSGGTPGGGPGSGTPGGGPGGGRWGGGGTPGGVWGGGTWGGGGGQGWPSPRSWEATAKLMAACKAADASADVLAVLVAGAVGEGAALEFLSWMEHLDLPDPMAVLDDPDAFELPRRSDRAFAVLTSVVAVAVAAGDVSHWDAAWMVIAKAARTAPDVATLAARTLAGRRPPGARIPATLLELTPILRAAGLL